MFRLLPIIFLLSCAPYRIFTKEYITLSDSPCVDGTILNIDQAGCEGFYWGTDPSGVTLKIRCTYAPEDSFWTRTTFYSIPHNHDADYTNWFLFCEDRHVKMFAIPTGVDLEEK